MILEDKLKAVATRVAATGGYPKHIYEGGYPDGLIKHIYKTPTGPQFEWLVLDENGEMVRA